MYAVLEGWTVVPACAACVCCGLLSAVGLAGVCLALCVPKKMLVGGKTAGGGDGGKMAGGRR